MREVGSYRFFGGERASPAGHPATASCSMPPGDGDEDAFGTLVEPHRSELHAHCYRMLGSVHDAEDALQEALLRAWRGLPGFEGRSSLRSWLYRIATNACLRRDRAPAQAACCRSTTARPPTRTSGPAQPLVESVWVEPYPDDGARRRARLAARGPLRAARGRRARVHRRAAAPAGAPARRADPARRARLLARARSPRRSTRRRPRSTARCSAPTRPSTSGCPSGASRRRCARSATRALRDVVERATSTPGSAATSTRSSRCSPTTR